MGLDRAAVERDRGLNLDEERPDVFDKSFLIRALRERDRENPSVMTVIVVRYDDAFDFASLGRCPDCDRPGLPHGQTSDWRIAAGHGQGLHGYVFQDRIEFHLDAVDACRDVVGHVARDTAALPGALLGAFAGAALAGLSGGKGEAIGAAAVAGAVGGGLLGAHVPARSTKRIELRELVATFNGAAGGWAYGQPT